MAKQQTDILKQPLPTLLVCYATLMVVLTLRAQRIEGGSRALFPLSPLGEWVDGVLAGGWGVATVVVEVLLGSIIITRITGRYSLSVIRSFVPMVLYVVAVCGVILPVWSPSLTLALLMLVVAAEQNIQSFRRSEQFGYVMTASFWTGLAVLLVPDLVYTALLLPLQWIIWQRSPREMVAGVVMFLLPLLPTSFCWWVGGKEPLWLVGEWAHSLSPLEGAPWGDMPSLVGGVLSLILWGFVVVLALAGALIYAVSYGDMRIRARKGHAYFAALFALSLLMCVAGVSVGISVPLMGFASVPLIYTFFTRRKGVLSTVVYVVLLLLSLSIGIVCY